MWVEEQAKILVDMGGGAFLRFGQSQAKLSDLAMIAISHLHPDHVSDLPALLWLSQQIRQEPLLISGPSGNDQAPEFPIFLSRLFDENNGAFPLLSSTLGGGQGRPAPGVRLDVRVVDVAKPEPTKVLDRAGIAVTALGIPHGGCQRWHSACKRAVSLSFSAPIRPEPNRSFTAFAKGANVLIMHMTIDGGASSPLHASPLVVGQIARDAQWDG